MTDRTDVPPLPAPLTNQPVEVDSRGCSIAVLWGCGGGLLLLLVAAGLFLANSDDMVRWAFARSQEMIIDAAAEDVPRSELERLRLAYAAVVESSLHREMTFADTAAVQQAIAEALRQAQEGSLTGHDLRRLSERLEAVAGAPSETAPPEPNGEIHSDG